jgi:hypothetical protein
MHYRGLSSVNTIALTGAGTLFHATIVEAKALFMRSKMYMVCHTCVSLWPFFKTGLLSALM